MGGYISRARWAILRGIMTEHYKIIKGIDRIDCRKHFPISGKTVVPRFRVKGKRFEEDMWDFFHPDSHVTGLHWPREWLKWVTDSI